MPPVSDDKPDDKPDDGADERNHAKHMQALRDPTRRNAAADMDKLSNGLYVFDLHLMEKEKRSDQE